MQFIQCSVCGSKFIKKDYEIYICPRADETEHCPRCFPCTCVYRNTDDEPELDDVNFDNCLQQYLTQCDDCGLVYDKRKDYCLLCLLEKPDYSIEPISNDIKRRDMSIINMYKSVETFYSDSYKCICIETAEGTIVIGISAEQECCESWGIFTSPRLSAFQREGNKFIDLRIDERDDFIQKIIHRRFKNVLYNTDLDQPNYVTVSIYTTFGKLVVVVWTRHNGYYPHKYYIDEFGEIRNGRI